MLLKLSARVATRLTTNDVVFLEEAPVFLLLELLLLLLLLKSSLSAAEIETRMSLTLGVAPYMGPDWVCRWPVRSPLLPGPLLPSPSHLTLSTPPTHYEH